MDTTGTERGKETQLLMFISINENNKNTQSISLIFNDLVQTDHCFES